MFHRAITQSGATGCPWALQKNVGNYTRILAEDLNCPTSNSRELLDCLRNTEAEKIMDSRKKLTMTFVCIENCWDLINTLKFLIISSKALGLYPVAFGPRIDSERLSPFLPDSPQSLVQRKQFNQVPVIFGLNKDEGGLFAASKSSI